MGEYCCRIEKMRNGFEVELKDPQIVKANQKSGKEPMPYRDPYVSYVFKTVDEVVQFLSKNLDKALPDDEYGTSFDEAVEADDD